MDLMTCAQAMSRHEGSVTCLTINRGKIISGSVDNNIKVMNNTGRYNTDHVITVGMAIIIVTVISIFLFFYIFLHYKDKIATISINVCVCVCVSLSVMDSLHSTKATKVKKLYYASSTCLYSHHKVCIVFLQHVPIPCIHCF